MSLFRKPVFLAVTLGHFAIDIFNSSGPVLVAFLSVPMALSATQIGIVIGAYQFFSALTQPLFGWMDDKIGSRWLGPASVAWTIGFIAVAIGVAQQTNSFYGFLIPFVLASVGSSAFHPMGTKHAAETSAERAATGTAIFFLFGQAGLACGPILMGIILDHVGLSGIYGLAALAAPAVFFLAFGLRHSGPKVISTLSATTTNLSIPKSATRWGAIIILALLVGFRSWPSIGTVTFLPKLFQDMGWNATNYGLITGTYWMASAVAGVVVGNLADRFGRRQVVFISLLAGSIPLYFLPLNSGWQAFPLAILSGGLIGASHSVIVVIAQTVLPGGKSFASGLTLGFLFGSGAIAAWIIGWLADSVGLGLMIQAGTLFGILAAIMALFLPVTKDAPHPQVESVPA